MRNVATVQDEINTFFYDPVLELPQQDPIKVSVLYLLRRDISSAIGFDRKNEIFTPEYSSLFFGLSGIMTGIDLVAKFHNGETKPSGSSARFPSFVEQYFPFEESSYAKVIYSLRNALIHSFGLYDKNIQFLLTSDGPSPSGAVEALSENTYKIYGRDLFLSFEFALKRYFDDLLVNDDLQDKFHKVYKEYGTLTFERKALK